MKNGIFSLLLVIVTTLPALAAPSNSGGPWGINITTFSSFSSASHSPVTDGKTMVITNTVDCNNLTIPANRAIEVKMGGKIRYSGNLVINGPFDAGLYKVLEKVGNGTVKFTNKSVLPDWWNNNTSPGETNMTAALREASLASPSVIIDGTYLITDTITISQHFANIGGTESKYGKIIFNPASDKILFHLTGCKYRSGYFGAREASIRNLVFASTNTVQKTAIKVEDGSLITLENLSTDSLTWTSTTNNCIGLHLAGRELHEIKNIMFYTEYPIKISKNTQFTTNTGISDSSGHIDCDLYHFSNLGLVAVTIREVSSGKPNIMVDDDVNIYNLKIDGYNSFGKGSGIFYYNNTNVAGQQSFSWEFTNMRYEQGDRRDNTWAIYAKSVNNYINNVTINNLQVDGNSQGWNIEKVRGLSVKNVILNSISKYAYKMNSILSCVFENLHYRASSQVDNGNTPEFSMAIPYADGDYNGYVFAVFGYFARGKQ